MPPRLPQNAAAHARRAPESAPQNAGVWPIRQSRQNDIVSPPLTESPPLTKSDIMRFTCSRTGPKWSKPLWTAGWNGIPSVIIERQEALGLDALDMNIILHLSNYWWTPENLPFPSIGTIAKAVG